MDGAPRVGRVAHGVPLRPDDAAPPRPTHLAGARPRPGAGRRRLRAHRLRRGHLGRRPAAPRGAAAPGAGPRAPDPELLLALAHHPVRLLLARPDRCGAAGAADVGAAGPARAAAGAGRGAAGRRDRDQAYDRVGRAVLAHLFVWQQAPAPAAGALRRGRGPRRRRPAGPLPALGGRAHHGLREPRAREDLRSLRRPRRRPARVPAAGRVRADGLRRVACAPDVGGAADGPAGRGVLPRGADDAGVAGVVLVGGAVPGAAALRPDHDARARLRLLGAVPGVPPRGERGAADPGARPRPGGRPGDPARRAAAAPRLALALDPHRRRRRRRPGHGARGHRAQRLLQAEPQAARHRRRRRLGRGQGHPRRGARRPLRRSCGR